MRVIVRLTTTAGIGSHAGGPPSSFWLSRQARVRSAMPATRSAAAVTADIAVFVPQL